MLTLSDDGSGMDQTTLEQIFEPFFTTKEVGKGTGLGLSTVYGILKQNGGFTNVYSEPGKGTTFKIYIPRYQGDITQSESGRSENIPKGYGETILLVEDDASVLNLSKMMLERLGYDVFPANRPDEAMEMAREHTTRIRLLMADVVMPQMSGKDLARQIAEIHPDIQTLFMSGYTANVIAHQGILDEGVNFIEKPFSMNELGRKTREALKKGER
jgi:two-component system, cell cycle sensor histidine kinase and response regulator CckA